MYHFPPLGNGLSANIPTIIDIRVNERDRKLPLAAGNASYLYRINLSQFALINRM